jgi:hypothetical protein
MTTPRKPDQIEDTVLRLLGQIALEADLTALKPDVGFRDQLDLDSMDFLNFVILLHNLDIPESDYPKYATLKGCLEQLSELQR